mmetsp:Transcript_20482/g.40980  ORF Transcript_20482/g.40980 Transcript_20482/m.40980 type:complete len:135 (+) Transcript_20482:221-625(+)
MSSLTLSMNSAAPSTCYRFPFCPSCGTHVNFSSTGELHCPACGLDANLRDMPSDVTSKSSSSKNTVQPVWAKSNEEQQRMRDASGLNRATVDEPCPKCDAPEVTFYTLQLRSVDEGQTVFYDCPQCNYTWSVNN